MNDGRRNVCENEAPLINIIVEKVLSAQKGRVFSIQEIYDELLANKLYHFSPDAKTPCCTISTRLSTGVQARFPRLKKYSRGHYFAI